MTLATSPPTWSSPWLDVVAFAAGLAVAWMLQWRATDLVWSLWLSSLVVGCLTILWQASAFPRQLVGRLQRDPSGLAAAVDRRGRCTVLLVATIAAAVMLGVAAFMTLHFVGFHYVHASFLGMLFPLDGLAPVSGLRHFPTTVGEVFQRYWPFLPSAFIAQRVAFAGRSDASRDDGSVTASAIARRKARNLLGDFASPYRNVVRMHLLIFVFIAAHAAGITNFAVYALVYAAYYFPWRSLPGRPTLGVVPSA
ncbi:MAG: hypothetical protein JWL60_1146 [Gemmatimonadetes bacterium]|nr:hypothetical protein [Gemmatimonadota bacterium]